MALEIITNTHSFVFSMRLIAKLETVMAYRENSIIRNKLCEIISDKLYKYFIEENRDIFEEIKVSYIYILVQWRNYNRIDIKGYICSLIDKNPNNIGKLIVMDTFRPNEIDFGTISRIISEKTLYDYIRKHGDNAYSNDDEKRAINLFMKEYEKRQKPEN